MQRTRKKVLIAQLPPTPVTEDMRAEIVGIASNLGVSIAEVQRAAYSLFLSKDDSKTIITESKALGRVGIVKEECPSH